MDAEYAYFGTNCMYTRVPTQPNGEWDWEDAELGHPRIIGQRPVPSIRRKRRRGHASATMICLAICKNSCLRGERR